uniref:C2H2-type domain-containing protein n=1 Tax=Coturnix japonica TaxID=93934 RepID=A0A8C2T656_COTJA
EKNLDLKQATRHHLFTDTFCRVCWAVLPFESQRMSHYEGRKHAQNVYLYVQSHGRKDERMKCDKKKEIMDCTKNKYCNLCNIILASPDVASSHLQGKIHAQKLRQLAENKALVEVGFGHYICPVCNVVLTNVLEYQSHMKGKKHQTR